MEYSYPEIRDVLVVLAESVYIGDNRTFCKITPRSNGMATGIQNLLAQYGVKFNVTKDAEFSAISGAKVDTIDFSLGQNFIIDTTMREMFADKQRLINVNNRFLNLMQRNPNARRTTQNRDAFTRGTADVHSKASIDELKKLIKFIDDAYYTDDPNHHYCYLYFNDIDRAFDIMSELGVRGIEKYYSSSKNTYVLRLDQDKVSSVAQNIITELQREIATRGINYSNRMGGRFKI